MKALVLNVGSSSLKTTVFNNEKEVSHQYFEDLFKPEDKIKKVRKTLSNQKELDCIIHRVVHGGKINSSKIIKKNVLNYLLSIQDYAPLHNPPQLKVIKFCLQQTNIKNIAVFDTAFHSSMPKKAKHYAIPKKLTEKGFKKYGFHGPSHQYITRNLEGGTISCHLGSGCSLAAVQDGTCLDTTMGFTPLEGLMMSTRSGDIDPGLLLYLIEHDYYNAKELNNLLNKKSGWFGVSQVSKDFREVIESNKEEAKLAVDMFCYKTAKQIMSLTTPLKQFNHLVFTAGIGERNAHIRKKICTYLQKYEVLLNESKNAKNAKIISKKNSKVKVHVIPTQEELMMYLEAKKIL